MLSAIDAAAMIDISAVRTQHTLSDILELVEYAKKYRFVNVHVLPCWVSTLAEMIRDIDGVYVGSPVGFPSGGEKIITKVLTAQQLIEDGVQEMDIVMNIGKLKNGNYEYVNRELREIVGLADKQIIIKVIIEISVLTDEEILDACDIAIQSGADFVKTGTGWIFEPVNINRIRKIKEYCGSQIKVKAAGGIRTLDDFIALHEIGVERMGINLHSAIEIVENCQKEWIKSLCV